MKVTVLYFLPFLVLFSFGQDDVRKVKKNSFLLHTFEVINASKSTAEKITDKIHGELLLSDKVHIQWVHDTIFREEAKIKSKFHYRMMDRCNDPQCAGEVAKGMGYDFSIIGKIEKEGNGFVVNVQIVDAKTLSVVYKVNKKIRKNKRAVIKMLPSLGRHLSKVISRVYFPNKKKEVAVVKPKKGWKTKSYDPLTTHLIGKRISGTISDTLKLSKSPYILTSSAVVPSGKTLVIEPGVTLYIGGRGTHITVLGKISARGTKEKSITIMSGRKGPSPGDWDRISFKSRQRSVFEYVHIKHSIYGVVAENSAVTLQSSHLSHNREKSVYLENSDVELVDTKITDGRGIGIQIGEFGEATVERVKISGNQNGISVMNFGNLVLRSSKVEGNDRGLLLQDSVSLVLENSEIESNRIGVASNAKLKKRDFLGVRKNDENFVVLKQEHIQTLLQPPKPLKSERKKKFTRRSKTKKKKPRKFVSGIRSVGQAAGYETGILGNVSMGFDYHYPQSAENKSNRFVPVGNDTIYPGKEFPQDKIIPGLYQTNSVFTSINFGRYSLDGNFDLKWDEWGGVQLEGFSVKSKLGPQKIGFGDFVESGSEISMSSLPLRGVKYGVGLFQNRRGQQRISFSGAYGESERPFDEGERVLGSYGEVKSEGSAVAQKMAGVAKLNYLVKPNIEVRAHYVYSEDKRKTLLREDLSSTSVTAQSPLLSNLVGMETEWRFLKDAVSFTTEVNVGTVDSLSQAYNLALDKVLSDRGIGESGATLKSILQPTASDSLIDANIAEATQLLIDSSTVFDSLTNLGEAANIDDVLKTQRTDLLADLTSEAEGLEPGLQDKLDESKSGGFRWDAQGISARVAANINVTGFSLDADYSYIGFQYYTGGNPFLTKDQRKYNLALTKDLGKKWSINSKYGLTVENASSEGQFGNLLGFGEGSESGVLSDGDFQSKREALDVSRPKFTHKMSFNNRYKPVSIVELNLNYNLQYKSENKSSELDPDSLLFADAYFKSDNSTLDEDTIVYENITYLIDGAKAQDFSNNVFATATPTSLGTTLQDKEISHQVEFKSRLRFSKWGNIRMSGKWKWKDDLSSYKNSSVMDQYGFNDSSLIRLGFYQDGEDEFQQDYKSTLALKSKVFSNKIDGKFGLKNKIKREENVMSWGVKNNFTWKVIPRKLKLSIVGNVRMKTTDEDDDRFYVEDGSNGKRYFYLDTNVNNQSTFLALSDDVRGSLELSATEPDSLSNQIIRENFRKNNRENDYSAEVKVRYNFNSRFYLETILKQEWFLRPDQLEQEYQDASGTLKMFYSF